MFSIPQHQSAHRSLLQLSAPQSQQAMRKEQPYHPHVSTPRPQKPTETLRTLLGPPFSQQQPTRQMPTPQLPSSSSRPVRDRKQTPKAASLAENQKEIVAAVLAENQKEIVAATSHAAALMKKRTPVLNQRRISTSYMGGIRPPTALLHATPRLSLPSSIPASMDDSVEVIELDSPSPPAGTKPKLLSARMPSAANASRTAEQNIHDAIAARLAALQKQMPSHPAIRSVPVQKRYNQPAASLYSIKPPPSNSLPTLKMTIQKAVVPRLTDSQIAATLNRLHNPFIPSASNQKKVIMPQSPLQIDDLNLSNAQKEETMKGGTPAPAHPKRTRVSKKKEAAVTPLPAATEDEDAVASPMDWLMAMVEQEVIITPSPSATDEEDAVASPMDWPWSSRYDKGMAVTPVPSSTVEEDAVASPMDWLMAMVEQAIPEPAPAAVHTSNSDEENFDVTNSLLNEEMIPGKKAAKKRRRAPATPVSDAIHLATPPSSEKKRRLAPTIHIDPVCANCGTRETSQWRRLGEGSEVECNPCSLYFKKRGHARPAELNREIQRRCRKSEGVEENNNKVPKRRYRKSEKIVALDLESALEAIVPRENDEDGSS